MGRVSTTNLKEAKETGKIYLDKEFFKRLPELPKPIIRCKQCRNVIGDIESLYLKNIGFCSQVCRDDYDVVHNPVEHNCNKCGKAVLPICRKDGRKSGMYRRLCNNCANKRRKNKGFKICKVCGILKQINDFRIVKNIHLNTCKSCMNKELVFIYKPKPYIKPKHKICKVCGLDKDIELFYSVKNKNMTRRCYTNKCKECRRKEQIVFRENKRKLF